MMQNPEFSRTVSVESLDDGGTVIEIEAAAGERKALAGRFGLLGLDSLTAKVDLTPLEDGIVRLRGVLKARAIQACVVTLAPVPSLVEATFERLYGPGAAEEDAGALAVMEPEDPPEPIPGGAIDVGEAVAEQLALELDPFPRAAGAAFDGFSSGPRADGDKDRDSGGPFAVLAKLKEKPENGA